LQRLATQTNPETLRTLAENPNLPLSLVVRLAEKFPRQARRNPALSMASLEHPDFFSRLTRFEAVALLSGGAFSPQVRSAFLARKETEIAWLCARNRQTPPQEILGLAEKQDWGYFAALSHPALGPAELATLSVSPQETARALVARHPRTPPTLRATLTKDPSEKVARLADAYAAPRFPLRPALQGTSRTVSPQESYRYESTGIFSQRRGACVAATLEGFYRYGLSGSLNRAVQELAYWLSGPLRYDPVDIALAEVMRWLYYRAALSLGYNDPRCYNELLLCGQLLFATGQELHHAFLGDARLYRLRAGEAEQLNREHTLINHIHEYAATGQADLEQLSKDPAWEENLRTYQNVLVRALMANSERNEGVPTPDIQRLPLVSGDLYALLDRPATRGLGETQLGPLLARWRQEGIEAAAEKLAHSLSCEEERPMSFVLVGVR
jgi:hypothetical protein